MSTLLDHGLISSRNMCLVNWRMGLSESGKHDLFEATFTCSTGSWRLAEPSVMTHAKIKERIGGGGHGGGISFEID